MDEVWHKLYHKHPAASGTRIALRIGDHVRISGARQAFERGYTPNWSEEVFVVTKVLDRVRSVVYGLKDMDDEDVKGTFYEEELQRVDKPETFRIREVLKSHDVGGRREALVSWMGYPAKFNKWIPWP